MNYGDANSPQYFFFADCTDNDTDGQDVVIAVVGTNLTLNGLSASQGESNTFALY